MRGTRCLLRSSWWSVRRSLPIRCSASSSTSCSRPEWSSPPWPLARSARKYCCTSAGDRQRHAVGVAGLERDVEVLVVQVDAEARREVVLEEVAAGASPSRGWRRGRRRARRGSSSGSTPALEPSTSASLTAAIVSATTTWLQALTTCPAPVLADVDDRLAEHLEQRLRALEVGVVAADHDRQRALLGADVAAADRGVEHGDAALGARPRATAIDTVGWIVLMSISRSPLRRAGEDAVVAAARRPRRPASRAAS